MGMQCLYQALYIVYIPLAEKNKIVCGNTDYRTHDDQHKNSFLCIPGIVPSVHHV